MLLSKLLGNQPLLNLLPKFFSVQVLVQRMGKLDVLSFDLPSYTMFVNKMFGKSTSIEIRYATIIAFLMSQSRGHGFTHTAVNQLHT